MMSKFLLNECRFKYRCIPNEQRIIEETLNDLATIGCNLIVTTEGIAPASKDATTEAAEALCRKLLPGFEEQMRTVSLQLIPTAILSRKTAGVCENFLQKT